jgi:hypothetical protein
MSKKWGLLLGISMLVLSAAVVIHQNAYAIPSNATTAATTKTFQDFGLGFKIEYPSNMTIEKGSNNITLLTQEITKPPHALSVVVVASPWAAAMGITGLFSAPSLDTLARQVGLALANDTTVTNKTKVVVDNTPAYLIQGVGNLHGKTSYLSSYLAIKDNAVYIITFRTTDQAKFQPIEHKIIQSFRFV